MTQHPDTVRLRRMELALLERDRRIRDLEDALARNTGRCSSCGSVVILTGTTTNVRVSP